MFDISEIDVYFKENEFFPLIRQRQFTESDFLSYIGGTLGKLYFLPQLFLKNIRWSSQVSWQNSTILFFLLGLFAGFSVLTFFELIIFVFFRIPLSKFKMNTSKVFPFKPTEDQINQNVEIQKFFLKPSKYFYNYMEHSSLHGLSHASLKNLHVVERIFWTIAFTISMVTCGIMLNNSYNKYSKSPIAISLDGDPQSVNDVRFSRVFLNNKLRNAFWTGLWNEWNSGFTRNSVLLHNCCIY